MTTRTKATHRWSHLQSTNMLPMNPRLGSRPRERELTDWLPLAGGASLLVLALSSRSRILGLGAVLGGGYLLKRAFDHGAIPRPPKALTDAKTTVREIGCSFASALSGRDDVDEASRQSFPASDPPARY